MIKFPEQYLKAIDLAYPKIIEVENRDAKIAMDNLFSNDIETLATSGHKVLIAAYLKQLHNDLMFFKNDELIIKLKRFNLSDIELRWFVSLNDIDNQFNLIKEKGIVIDRPTVLAIIRVHLSIKFSKQILFWCTSSVMDDGVCITGLTKYLSDLKERHKYGKGTLKSYKDDFDIIMNMLINDVTNETNGKVDINTLLIATKGKTEKVLFKYLLEECFCYDKAQMSETKFLSSLYGLFQIIFQDYGLLNQGEFDDIDIQETNFDIFKAKRIKKIIYKR